jgi:hypothetical protein
VNKGIAREGVKMFAIIQSGLPLEIDFASLVENFDSDSL